MPGNRASPATRLAGNVTRAESAIWTLNCISTRRPRQAATVHEYAFGRMSMQELTYSIRHVRSTLTSCLRLGLSVRPGHARWWRSPSCACLLPRNSNNLRSRR